LSRAVLPAIWSTGLLARRRASRRAPGWLS